MEFRDVMLLLQFTGVIANWWVVYVLWRDSSRRRERIAWRNLKATAQRALEESRKVNSGRERLKH